MQLFKKTKYGFIIDWKFHSQNKWVCSLTKYLVNSIIERFNPIIISSQLEYEFYKGKIDYIISMEPGWAAPKIKYDIKRNHTIGVFLSDPHSKTVWFNDYFNENKISFVFSYYNSPFFYHFPNFDKDKFVHIPWAIPDHWLTNEPITYKGNGVVIFGGQQSDAYDMRNWCRVQDCVINYNNSGVEYKKFSDEEYFNWLKEFDCVIAAGSTDPKYDMVTPKYFEICAAGSLLIGQYCEDLKELGFNDSNALIFDSKVRFLELVRLYNDDPDKFVNIRKSGIALITEKHKVSDRIKKIEEVFVQKR